VLRAAHLPTEFRLLTMLMGRGATRRLVGEEAGFTLTELLSATALSMIVIAVGVTLFTAGIKSQARINSQAAAIQDARTTMERLTREVRQATTVPSATGSQLAIVTYVDDASCGSTTPVCRVTYSCVTSGKCTRTVARPDGSSPGPSTTVVEGLSSTNVFTYTPPTPTAPASVGITLKFPAEGGSSAITLTDGATLRNSPVT